MNNQPNNPVMVGYYFKDGKVYKLIPAYEGTHITFSPYLLQQKHRIHTRLANETETKLLTESGKESIDLKA